MNANSTKTNRRLPRIPSATNRTNEKPKQNQRSSSATIGARLQPIQRSNSISREQSIPPSIKNTGNKDVRNTVSTRGLSPINRHQSLSKPPIIPRKHVPPPVLPRTSVSNVTKKEYSPKPKDRQPRGPLLASSLDLESKKIDVSRLSLSNSVSIPKHVPGLCGLINNGNTCFVNSALQCLSNIPALKRWAEDQAVLPTSMNPLDIVDVFSSLIQLMSSGETKCTNPENIKNIVSRSSPFFADRNQKDSHEFLNSLLNLLEKSPRAKPMIEKLFYLHTKSQVTCHKCGENDDTDEINTFLPLPLAEPKLKQGELSLEQLVQDFTTEENLAGQYYCHRCQMLTQAKQKTILCSPLPDVLIIQLQRFPFDGTSRKIDTFVRYQLEYDHLLSSNDRYQLSSVIVHVGSLAGGHYTTLAKNFSSQQWYRFNDTNFDQIDTKFVETTNAYILVYLKSEKCL